MVLEFSALGPSRKCKNGIVKMDQNTSGGNDKRNWRERLGIGTKEAAGKDMPRVANEFTQAKPAAVPAQAAQRPVVANVKLAPMAPRPAARPVAAAPALASRPPALQPDALALKLKSQREAAEKMAEQRVFAARQRAEAALAPVAAPQARPKFAFADDDAKPAKPIAQPHIQQQPVQQQRAPLPPPQARPAAMPPPNAQIAPPRPQLGGNVPVPQRAPMPQQQAYPQGQPYNQQQGYPNNYVPIAQQQPQQNYAPPPAYRPIDPATGYAPPPNYIPTPAYTAAPAPRPNYDSGQPAQPRLQIPPRAPQLSPAGYDTRTPPAGPRYAEQEPDDIFERPAPQRGQRRATANDYQQAYRDVEAGYDEESRSNVPWILVGLLALVLAGFGSIWAYANYVKPAMLGNIVSTEQAVPVVKAPEQATKVTPTAEPVAVAPAAGQAAPPTKKQIYDRIVGDREVLGGEIVPTEETPVQPTTNAQPIPATDAGTGADGVPLPLPPPPGDGTQGSLEPAGKGDQQVANITPAAGESLAADSQMASPPALASAPVPGEAAPLKPAQVDQASAAAAPPAPAEAMQTPPTTEEKIQDAPAAESKPIRVQKIVAPKKIVAAQKTEKSLGFRPVVLVPAVKQVTNRKVAKVDRVSTNAGESLYGDATEGTTADVVAQSPVTAVTAAPKRKSLLDLFKRDKASVGQQIADTPPAVAAEPAQQVASLAAKPAPEIATPKPTGAFVAQLASFKSKSEANQEYARMKAKHGAIISRYAPIISQAQVAGTTRYRLNLGPMASSGVASSFCQSLFAAGERDCLVQRQ
jgi:SPOR domain